MERQSWRCVVGLEFFGCAIGELAPPDGSLFDTLRDRDRPRSSVPEPGGNERQQP